MTPDATSAPVVTPAPSQLPTPGRVVLVTLRDREGVIIERPADIVRVWTATCVNAIAKLDGGNDDADGALHRWITSATYQPSPVGIGATPVEGAHTNTWRWPPRV